MRFLVTPVRRLAVTLALLAATTLASAADRKVLLIAGLPSHGPGAHEHNAGMLLFQKCLRGVPGLSTEVVLNGWPKDAAVFDHVDAVLIYSDGGERHPAIQGDNLLTLRKLVARGAGVGFLHYAVEPTLPKGQSEFLRWIGGAFEINWSVNPHWDADFKTLPHHPVTHGVAPFKLRDEWYFNLRWVDGQIGLVPILAATPDASTTTRRDGPHSGNPHVRAAVARGDKQTVAWAYERADGTTGRGFGLTGGHFHQNWANEDLRRLVLNAILWLAHLEVPATGVQSQITPADLEANLDPTDPDSGRKLQPTPEQQGIRASAAAAHPKS